MTSQNGVLQRARLGHSPQPRPMGEAVKMESEIIDVIGTPMGILPEHCDLIGGDNDSNKT